MRNDPDNSLQELCNHYAGADPRRNFELDLQSRKFDPKKEQQDDFLTYLQRLAILAIVDDDDAGLDRTVKDKEESKSNLYKACHSTTRKFV